MSEYFVVVEKRRVFNFFCGHFGDIFAAFKKNRLHSRMKAKIFAVQTFGNVYFHYVRSFVYRDFLSQQRVARNIGSAYAPVRRDKRTGKRFSVFKNTFIEIHDIFLLHFGKRPNSSRKRRFVGIFDFAAHTYAMSRAS